MAIIALITLNLASGCESNKYRDGQLFLDVTEVNPIPAQALIKLHGMVLRADAAATIDSGTQHPNVAWRRERT